MVWGTRYKSASPMADMARCTAEILVLTPIDRETCGFSIHTYHPWASPVVIAAVYSIARLLFRHRPYSVLGP
jgi:hypothetical protein